MVALLRQLPNMNAVLTDPRVAALPRPVALHCARGVLNDLRVEIRAGSCTSLPDIGERVVRQASLLLEGRLRPVLNATGIVVHTNLGRAPWAPEVISAAMARAAYCNLEIELEDGERGGRLHGVQRLLSFLTGSESALVVNNCAAAVLLALTTYAKNREVLVSRGELVEIGGSFRVPDVIASGGAKLVEVGTTNRTRAVDYRRAVSPDTAVLLKVHSSNFRIVGFTESTPREHLVAIAKEHGLLVVEDLGSGSLDGEGDEPGVRDAITQGVDVVLFSGDKLLGGPQVGIAVGRSEAIAAMRHHPLYRALRVDKVILAALEATLALHARGGKPPVAEMIARSPQMLKSMADILCEHMALLGIEAAVVRDVSYVGGGSCPEESLPTWIVAVTTDKPHAIATALRTGTPAIVPRVAQSAVRFDVRTLTSDALPVVAQRLAAVLVEEKRR